MRKYLPHTLGLAESFAEISYSIVASLFEVRVILTCLFPKLHLCYVTITLVETETAPLNLQMELAELEERRTVCQKL